jgi:predicted RNA binding protein YcfA (HicA-like mRNA interferase family)
VPTLPRLTAREVIELLEQHGWLVSPQSGSHVVLKKTGALNNV